MQANKQQTNLVPLHVDPRGYRFFPTKKQQKTSFDKKGTRFFFYGQVQYDEYEQRKLKEFYEYVDKKETKYDTEFFKDQQVIMQFLSASKYKPKDTLKAMEEHRKFRMEYVPAIQRETFEHLLKVGYYYTCGRDRNFRPILVFRIKYTDPKKMDPCFDCLVHLQEQVIEMMMLPGQIQSYSIIYDLEGISLSDLPISSIKKITGSMSLNYGGRLFKLWIVNAPSGLGITWKIISAFLDPITVEKIRITKNNTEKNMFEIADPSQIEVRYGGSQQNRTQYYPYEIPEGVFDEQRLISEEQYEGMFKEGKLSKNKVNPVYLQKKE